MWPEVLTLDDLQNRPDAFTGAKPPVRLSVFRDPVAHWTSPMHNAALDNFSASASERNFERIKI